MTAHRRPGSIDATVLAAMRLLSDDEIETATGKQRSWFYKVANPAQGYGLHLDDAAALDAALMRRGEPPLFAEIFIATTAAARERLAPVERRPVDTSTAFRKVACEFGELAKAVDTALADRKVSLEERRAIAREAQDVIEAATRVRDAAEPPEPIPFRRTEPR